MGVILAGVCGIALAGGVMLVVAGIRNPPSSTGLWKKSGENRVLDFARRRWWQLLVAILGGLMVAVFTGWPLMIGLVPMLAFGLPILLSSPPNRDLAVLEALDRWVRTLAALLPTGRSIAEAIRLSQRQAPPLLADQLWLLQARLEDRWPVDQAILAMADELKSADADAILAALALAAERGGTGAAATLSALADNLQDRLRAFREIETERAKPRIVVRQVSLITIVVLGVALAFGGSFFEPYRTPLGQLLLAALILAYLGSLLLLRQLTLPPVRQRILRRVAS